MKIFGIDIKDKGIWIYPLLLVFFGIGYIASAVSLYAFDALFGIPKFSWWNVVLWMIVLVTFKRN